MRHFTKEQKEIINNELIKYVDHKCSKSILKEISTKLKFVSPETLRNYLYNLRKENGVNVRIRFENLIVNYFKTIDSSNKAYLLGLFVSDGHLSSKRNLFSVTSIDYEIVKFFADEINNGDYSIIKQEFSTKYNTNKKSENIKYIFRIERKEFIDYLRRFKITSGKNKLQNFSFSAIPKEFRSAFIRGVFDGDGCISYSQAYKRGKPCGRPKPTYYICSPEINFLKLLQEELSRNNINMRIFSDDKIYYLRNSSIEMSVKFYNYIYQDNSNLFLSRKKYKFCYVNTEVINEDKKSLTP